MPCDLKTLERAISFFKGLSSSHWADHGTTCAKNVKKMPEKNRFFKLFTTSPKEETTILVGVITNPPKSNYKSPMQKSAGGYDVKFLITKKAH